VKRDDKGEYELKQQVDFCTLLQSSLPTISVTDEQEVYFEVAGYDASKLWTILK
jgi:hypothetical protein